MKSGQKHIIYSLTCPVDGEIKYVGKTSMLLSQRLRGHLILPSGERMRIWIEALKSKKLFPIIEQIDEVSKITPRRGAYWEKYWIVQLEKLGFNLYNTVHSKNTIMPRKDGAKRIVVLVSPEVNEKIEVFRAIQRVDGNKMTKSLAATKMLLAFNQDKK